MNNGRHALMLKELADALSPEFWKLRKRRGELETEILGHEGRLSQLRRHPDETQFRIKKEKRHLLQRLKAGVVDKSIVRSIRELDETGKDVDVIILNIEEILEDLRLELEDIKKQLWKETREALAKTGQRWQGEYLALAQDMASMQREWQQACSEFFRQKAVVQPEGFYPYMNFRIDNYGVASAIR